MNQCLISNSQNCCFYKRDKEINYINISLLGELMGEISHDFNNSLTTILGFIQLMKNSDKLDDTLKSYVNIINEAALDGQSIVDKVQKFNRGRYSTDKEYININEVIEIVISMASVKWKSIENSSEIKFNVIKKLGSEDNIYCNPRELREVIFNIVINAIDSMDEGGTLSISTYDSDNKVIIEIEDTGMGMDEDIVTNIFEPFFSTKELRGNGIGLSISKKIIEEHEGSIEVISQLGKGSIFKIYLDKYISHHIIDEEAN